MSLRLLAISLFFAFFAPISNAGQIHCTGSPGESLKLQIEGTLLTDWIKDVKATGTDEFRSMVGRSAQLDADKNYNPRKYKNHSRFNLSNLTEVTHFEKFLPFDQCTINFLVPNDAMEKDRFFAPTIANCDQNGGTFVMDCTHQK